ncbi:PIN domain-containing protein [Vibrio sp. 1CM2L]|uniref:PIN domain-containing protein n=1 Tax=Vibrio sp. 1CM2L TaxID=2929166 RepID=UPI0020BEBFC8|nr:PIN domain-containing protein [Vibrio sp. 1CM2L]MCK8077298.1 PIN domain-containing protein [Vibrio sp. 1CM2L]
MQTRNVFIDTQSFMQQGFRFDSGVLKKLSKLGEYSLINIYISEIVKGEVESKLNDKSDQIIISKNRFTKDLAFIESGVPNELAEALKDFNDKLIQDQVHAGWNLFLFQSNVTVLDADQCSVKELVSRYFGAKFPFSEGKKKDEFPDAISLLSLQAWLDANEQQVYVISGDGDLIGYCEISEQCHSLKTISEFLEIYNQAEQLLTSVVHECIDKDLSWIEEVVSEEFMNSGFVFEGRNYAEVTRVGINRINIDDIHVIEVDDHNAYVSLQVSFNISADISGEDYEHAIWDGVDKEYAYIPAFTAEMTFDETYNTSIAFSYDQTKKAIIEFTEVSIEDGSDLTLYEADEFPYK